MKATDWRRRDGEGKGRASVCIQLPCMVERLRGRDGGHYHIGGCHAVESELQLEQTQQRIHSMAFDRLQPGAVGRKGEGRGNGGCTQCTGH